MKMTTPLFIARLAATISAAVLVAGCGQSEKFNRAAYDICLANAKKPGSELAAANFEPFEKSLVAMSTGDDQFRVSIRYEIGDKRGLYQCIAEKRLDGSFAAVF